jgi:hypothetical protein
MQMRPFWHSSVPLIALTSTVEVLVAPLVLVTGKNVQRSPSPLAEHAGMATAKPAKATTAAMTAQMVSDVR